MAYRINEFLTVDERLSAIRLGAMRKIASLGLTPSQCSAIIEKRGQSKGFSVGETLKTALTTCLLLGVPLGVAAYAVDSAIRPDRNRNRKKKLALEQFRDISNEYATQSQAGVRWK